jgi:proteasome lid subunit RPN8/RPN11
MKIVQVNRSVIDSLLSYASFSHPKEVILLLKGKKRKDFIVVDEVAIPPLFIRGKSFSSFPLHMLPIDFSIVGTAHSHPSGVLAPSLADLNNFYGRLMVITAFPYCSIQNVAAFDRDGKPTRLEIVRGEY